MSDEPKGREDFGLFDLPLQPQPPRGGGDAEAEPAGGAGPGPADPGEEPTRRRRRPRPHHQEPELPLFADDEPAWGEGPEAGDAAPMPATPPADQAAGPPTERPTGWGADAVADAAPRPVAVEPLAPSADEAPRRGRSPAAFRPRLLAAAVDLGIHLGAAGLGLIAALLLGVPVGLHALPAFALFLLVFSFLYSVVTLAFWGQTPGMVAAGLIARGGGDQPLTFGQTGLRWFAGLLTIAFAGLPLLLALTGRSLGDRLSGSDTFQRR